MKKYIAAFMALFFAVTAGYALEDNLYEMFTDYPEIKIYLNEVRNETKNPNVKTDLFKEIFEEMAKERINIDFRVVDAIEEADCIVNSRIKDYAYEAEALPVRKVPLFLNALAVIADTAEPKSASTLVVDYEVRAPADNEILYSYKNLTTEVREPREKMTEHNAYPRALRENIDRFIYRAFYEQKD